jgi:glucose-6-phosphate isomerase
MPAPPTAVSPKEVCMSDVLSWNRFADESLVVPRLGFRLDLSTMRIGKDATRRLEPLFETAFAEMKELEGGAVANPDESRRVGHYWLRAPELAPEAGMRQAIEDTLERLRAFGRRVREGDVAPPEGGRFEHLLVVGIGGSALGPQLAADALGSVDDPIAPHFLDNTDPEGMERVFATLGDALERTLAVVISKSGGTPETRNGLVETVARLERRGLKPAARLVAVTGEGSGLHERARNEGWLDVFPMWDWVGGRTSQTSAVGLLPMAILGHDVDALLEGARLMDEATRRPNLRENPAAALALAWHVATDGRGTKDMVVLPYRDRLLLFSRYLQQLVMESLGKEKDLEGRRVHQGIAVYGNKGSTDQHAYVQQLRDGVKNAFVTMIGTRDDGLGEAPVEVEEGVTSGDYLVGFLLGTRRALAESDRPVLSLSIPRVDARSLGALIALFERAVGLYASLVRINAYHQPGVEAGKKAAKSVLELQRALLAAMEESPQERRSAPEWAESVGRAELAVEALWLLEHLAETPGRPVVRDGGDGAADAHFGWRSS